MTLFITTLSFLMGLLVYLWIPLLVVSMLLLYAGRIQMLRQTRTTRMFVWPIFTLCAIALCLKTFANLQPTPSATHWGVTFSPTMSTLLGSDWKQAYQAITSDLRPHGIRLTAYWNMLEPKEGAWNFDDLDWQVEEARVAGIPIILAIGQKVPRWPECHFPSWLPVDDKTMRETRLLTYLETIVVRYRGEPHLAAWQVENEPLFAFGECPQSDRALFQKETTLVRQLDPAHSILTTDSGELNSWHETAREGDLFGTTLYTRVYNERLGKTAYPLTPEFYTLKRSLIGWLTGKFNNQFIVAELGAEPWGMKQIYEMTPDEQAALYTLDDMQKTIEFAHKTRFDTFYFWGVEWWYAAKEHGIPDYWSKAQELFSNMAHHVQTPNIQ